jgi:flagellar hook-basal body complex protein FliE
VSPASIQALAAHDEVAPLHAQRTASPVHGAGFVQHVADGLAQVNEQLLASQTDLQRLAVGEAENLHQLMVRLEESRVSLQLVMQVRSRVLEAYQDVMRMQI